MRAQLSIGARICGALCVAALFGCARGPRVSIDVPSESPSDIPGLIDFELRGVSAGHSALARSLGDVLDDEAVADAPLDELLPKSFEEEFFEVRVKDSASALLALRGRGDLLYAEREVELHALFTPDDPDFGKQWHLRAAGVQSAWEAARGAGVIVAVLDTGVLPLDDLDRTRLLPGFNFITHKGDLHAADDDHFHGTHVAGTIAESTDNGRGGAGMAPLAKILPLKVLSAAGSGSSAGIAEAIRYAADHGAQVINLSLGGGARSEALEHAVVYARKKGALIVAAAGNTGTRGVSFPAAYPDALAVSAVGPSGQLAPYSAFGPEISIAAPGGDKSLGEEMGVFQQTLDDSGKPAYRFLQGTSMATPHVSGAAALVASLGITSPDAIERLLLASAATPPRDAGNVQVSRAERYGAGLLDAGAAVRRATVRWGLARLALALLGALIAIGHARRLHQLRAKDSLTAPFWVSLVFFAGGVAVLAPLGLARIPGLALLALPPPAIPLRLVGPASVSIFATLATYLAWSALVPLSLAGLSRLATPVQSRASSRALGAVVCGLAFGQAGLLAQTALVGAIHLPGLPALLTAAWLLVNAALCWFAGRALLAPAGLHAV